MNSIKGDLIQLALDGRFDIIVHGCNCFCTMGAGIAKQIQTVFPGAWEADCQTPAGDKTKLGGYSSALINMAAGPLVVVNGYTQFHYQGEGRLADYNAIETLFNRLKTDFSGKRFGYPRIGAGLAGGDWEIISQIIDRSLAGENHTLVEFSRQ